MRRNEYEIRSGVGILCRHTGPESHVDERAVTIGDPCPVR
jgi:hypothetical protein